MDTIQKSVNGEQKPRVMLVIVDQAREIRCILINLIEHS